MHESLKAMELENNIGMNRIVVLSSTLEIRLKYRICCEWCEKVSPSVQLRLCRKVSAKGVLLINCQKMARASIIYTNLLIIGSILDN